ncbi:AAA family ATPase [Aquabacterium sp. UBA2148]|uniref:AAA family ATPase n=1 Tax=Aquabacterium sp. UBA2148 TaxID=1946042 RepID=UPI00258052B0|nr:ATP-binding protein [Aquabacterium sp. UBA2148]
MLKQLKVDSYSVFADATVNWSPGLNVIVGENGAGKSQLMKLAYSLAWVSHDQSRSNRQTKDELQKKIADKLVATCRPDYLGRLVSRQRGRNRCEVSASFIRPTGASLNFSFASNARSEVKLEKMPTAYLAAPPVFIPTREMLSIFPGFIAAYEDSYLSFEETYYDIAKALNGAAKKKHAAPVQAMIDDIEKLLDGHIKLEAGRFYLLPDRAGTGKIEVPLVAEGMRKLAMLAYLLINGALRDRSTLFWDEPETNLNPKLIVLVAKALVALAGQGMQVVLATHSLFLLRELSIQLRAVQQPVPATFIALDRKAEGEVVLNQSESVDGLEPLLMLEEDLRQTDRYLAHG